MNALPQNWHHDLDELPVAPLPAPPASPAPIVWMRPSPVYTEPAPEREHSPAFRAVVTAFAFVATLAIAPGIAAWLAGGMS